MLSAIALDAVASLLFASSRVSKHNEHRGRNNSRTQMGCVGSDADGGTLETVFQFLLPGALLLRSSAQLIDGSTASNLLFSYTHIHTRTILQASAVRPIKRNKANV